MDCSLEAAPLDCLPTSFGDILVRSVQTGVLRIKLVHRTICLYYFILIWLLQLIMPDLVLSLTAPNGLTYDQPTGLFIGGKFVQAVSGKTFETIDPA